MALRISGEKAMFYRVKFLGQQDTLLDDMGTHYFYQCHIQGTIDFIFGTARSLYEVTVTRSRQVVDPFRVLNLSSDVCLFFSLENQQCVITSTAETFGAIAAHHRSSPDDDTGFSFVRCVINGSGRVLLGRAWGTYSRTIYSYCYIEDMISPLGWSDWSDPSRQR